MGATIAGDLSDLWPLDRGVIFLNHGAFGACPTEVLRHQAALRAEMEAERVRFLSRELDNRLDAARQALAAFVGADPDDLAFVTNATSGVNAVLRSLVLSPGFAARGRAGGLARHDAVGPLDTEDGSG